ncbi:F-box DNA helicase 1 [Eucyclogobius newberryi]|uniref:F-box DNA helicase 1 n=1 Tax=Eucyclogobius newberryi TaxID=166745 RepID=UPI003B5B15B4
MEVAAKGKAKRKHLNVDDCSELSSAGSSSLTQPHVLQSQSKPQKALYPRTRSKRRKYAPAPLSPAGHQKGINKFYRVTGSLSSSPNKPQDPCSSTHTTTPRTLFPMDDPNKDQEEEEEDDVSLLAATTNPELYTLDEEDIDDASLLTVENIQENVEEEVDYLEGLTSEMFDEDFETSESSTVEVEPLPDAHFGLLGISKTLLEPMGCVDDLPEEILRQVFSLVPAQDLYCSVQLVCLRWKNIVEDPKFVPFKKKYFCYVMGESDTVHWVNVFVLKNIIKSPFDHIMRNLVILMAQHKLPPRFRPDYILECVKKHHLFPQADSCIRLRIPVIQEKHSLGIEGTNPYAAIAVILLLSESVEDIQSLVSLLKKCLSYTAISEYLHRMAMMLLVLKRKTRFHISNKLHYNIYYVLHLMENGSFAVSFDHSRHPQINLTGEQQRILSHDIQRDHILKIMAFAGTGKTTTLVKYAEQRPHLRFLYVAFNKSVAKEAERRFPSNVDCKTVHALAFGDVGRNYKIGKKLTYNMTPFSINTVLPKGRAGFHKSKIVMQTINTFLASKDEQITTTHIPSFYIKKKNNRVPIAEADIPLFLEDATNLWEKMKNVTERSEQAFYMTHDGYLKLWQLSRPCLSDKYDVIFIDEAQDCTPAILDVMLYQSCGKILVGDPHQQIYTFRGAINALETVDHTHIFYLTQSFRFGAEIAYVGDAILKVCKNVQKTLVGGKQKGGVSDNSTVAVADSVRKGVSTSRGKMAILSRTNVTVFSEAVSLTGANPNCRIHFVGGIQGIGLERIQDLWNIRQNSKIPQSGERHKPKYIQDKFLRIFARKYEKSFQALRLYAEQSEDRELEAKLLIVEKYGDRIPQLVSMLKMCHEDDYSQADFIMGTVHKAKGMEFDTVMVTDDFVKIPASRHNLHFHQSFVMSEIPKDEWNLIYVAVTRAKSSLIISESIRRLLTLDGEYFLKSDMPSALVKDNQPLPCCVSNCPNCITPGSAFIMSRRQIYCTVGESPGGALCERCVWARSGPMAFLMTDDVLSMAEIPENFQMARHHIMLLALF